MPIRKKLDEKDLDLLEVLEDEVWLTEFLRNTSDGEHNRALWPAQPWKYRDYQKQILTDKSKYISLTGGRAIGKCEPGEAKILTVGRGYMMLKDLVKETSFPVYALDQYSNLVQRRARVTPDDMAPVKKIYTRAGHLIHVTAEHPILTPDGWVKAENIDVGSLVGVLTQIPNDMISQTFAWHELRFFGYILLDPPLRESTVFVPKYKKIGEEFKYICSLLPVDVFPRENGFGVRRIKGGYFSTIRALYNDVGFDDDYVFSLRMSSMPELLMLECKDNLKVFLEALFAQFAEVSAREISIFTRYESLTFALQTMLLRFGIESRITTKDEPNSYSLEILDYENVYDFWKTFTLPGVSVDQLEEPVCKARVNAHLRYDEVVYVDMPIYPVQTYAVHVREDNNYISSNIYVHNTVVLEDKIIYEVVNYEREFPVTPEQVLTTANQSQMQPLLSKLIQRFTSSPLLKHYLQNNVNKQDGTMRFPARSKPFTFYFRIAGSKGENNVVGLHVPKVKIDEAQLYPPNAYTQLLPIINYWEPKTQLLITGVSNGLRNSVLYLVDQKDPKFKKYRIPSHNNPFYSREQDLQNLRDWGGENDDRYVQLVLGRHGSAAFQILTRDDFKVESFPFHNYRYQSNQKMKGIHYHEVLGTPAIPESIQLVMAIDTGFVDPTIIQLIGMDKYHIWRTYCRYHLNRIDFTEQRKIIHWLATEYNVQTIAMDIGAGGGGAGIMHALLHEDEYKNDNYNQRIVPVIFNEKIVVGLRESGEEVADDAKSHGTKVLVIEVQSSRLVFSDVDHEGISQLERISKQKLSTGKDRYFVLSDRGSGADSNDHIYASYICFGIAIDRGLVKPAQAPRKLASVSGVYT